MNTKTKSIPAAKTYWNHEGKHQAVYNELAKLIPATGEVQGDGNKALEALRVASNLYYRLHNDGEANEFEKVFNVSIPRKEGDEREVDFKSPDMADAERALDKVILAAAKEQAAKVKEQEGLPHNIKRDGFGGYLAKAEDGLYFCTTLRPGVSLPFGVYMRHGVPGGQFWKNDMPLASFRTREEANKFIDRLSGIAGTHAFFMDNLFDV